MRLPIALISWAQAVLTSHTSCMVSKWVRSQNISVRNVARWDPRSSCSQPLAAVMKEARSWSDVEHVKECQESERSCRRNLIPHQAVTEN